MCKGILEDCFLEAPELSGDSIIFPEDVATGKSINDKSHIKELNEITNDEKNKSKFIYKKPKILNSTNV